MSRTEFTQAEMDDGLRFSELRYPCGVRCYICKSKRMVRMARHPNDWRCCECGRQQSITLGLVMYNSNIPLGKWIVALEWFAELGCFPKCRELAEKLGIGRQAAADMIKRLRPHAGLLTTEAEPEEEVHVEVPCRRPMGPALKEGAPEALGTLRDQFLAGGRRLAPTTFGLRGLRAELLQVGTARGPPWTGELVDWLFFQLRRHRNFSLRWLSSWLRGLLWLRQDDWGTDWLFVQEYRTLQDLRP